MAAVTIDNVNGVAARKLPSIWRSSTITKCIVNVADLGSIGRPRCTRAHCENNNVSLCARQTNSKKFSVHKSLSDEIPDFHGKGV